MGLCQMLRASEWRFVVVGQSTCVSPNACEFWKLRFTLGNAANLVIGISRQVARCRQPDCSSPTYTQLSQDPRCLPWALPDAQAKSNRILGNGFRRGTWLSAKLIRYKTVRVDRNRTRYSLTLLPRVGDKRNDKPESWAKLRATNLVESRLAVRREGTTFLSPKNSKGLRETSETHAGALSRCQWSILMNCEPPERIA